MARSLIYIARIAVFAYVGVCVLLYVLQDRFLFNPLTNDAALSKRFKEQRVDIPGPESIIEGWWVNNPNSQSSAVLLYFGGNGEDILYSAEDARSLNARRMLVTNYRGYGTRAGKPSQQALFDDALASYDYAVKQPQVAAENVFVMGRSLGSGVATFVAANRPVRGVILITPYDSIASVAQDMYPWVPVKWLLRNKFPADTFAPAIKSPVLIIAGSEDKVIPPTHAQHLHAVWAGPKKIEVLSGAGHNDIQAHPNYYPLINEFLGATAVR